MIKKISHKLDKTKATGSFGGVFVFVGGIYYTMRVGVQRKIAQYRVQKMLAQNIIPYAQEKNYTKKNKAIQWTAFQMGLPRAYRGAASVFAVSFLVLVILTSQYYGPQIIHAEIRLQNFMKADQTVDEGMDLLKYEARSEDVIDSKAEFDNGTYSTGNFETGKSDLRAVDAVDDYLTIGGYGDVSADISNNEWWSESTDTCDANFLSGGTFAQTQWDDGSGWLELTSAGLTAKTGAYTSKTIDAGQITAWNSMSWISSRPTYKELPNNLGTESSYSAGNVSSGENLLLMHFNESSGTIYNTSGLNTNGTYNGTLWSQSGRFNTALGFDGVDDYVDLGQDYSSVIGGTGSVAFWMKTTQAGNNTPWDAPGIIGAEETGTGNDVFWGYITAGGNIAIQAGNDPGTQSTTVVNDDQWHHVALTRNHITGAVNVYVDGVLEGSDFSETGIKLQYFDGIGRIYDSGGSHVYYQGSLDEVSFWGDVMTAQEVYDQYRRGANRLTFQVRSCDDEACSGETFIGPDGTSATYYTEQTNDTVNLPSVLLSNVPNNRYIQYQVTFQTDRSTIGPELSCVTFGYQNYNVWNYRKCFAVDNTAAGAQDQEEYQIYLDFDTAALISSGKMQADGDDLRFVDADGNQLDYYIADDLNSASTRVWVKMKNIDANSSDDVCMYYGNDQAQSASSRENVFTYQKQNTIYHVLANTAETTVTDMASYTNDNSVSVGTYDDTLAQYESAHYPTGTAPTFSQTTAIRSTDPINGEFNADGTDTLVPVSFAGTSFVYRMDQWTNAFSFISPWCSANVTVRNANNAIVTNGTFTIAQGSFNNLTTTNNANGLRNDSAVMVEVTNGCPIMATHHSTASQGSMPLIPAATEWYGVPSGNLEIAAITNGTTVTVYYSNNTTATYNLNRGGHQYVAVAGSEGSENAVRVVANYPVGVNGIDDSDGTEMQTFLPVNEMGYRYYVPQAMQYFSVATSAGVTTKVDLYNNGTQCGVGAPNATYTVSPTGNYPGKIYFGSTTDGANIAAGACVVADHPIAAYYEYAAQNDEHNILNEKQNRQYQYGVSYSTGSEQSGSWNISGTTQQWSRRIPVTITNTSAVTLSDYQVRINAATEAAAIFARAQADGGDIRVAGGTNGLNAIPYALEGYNGTNSVGTIWTKVPTVAANGTTTFYIYYQPVLTLQTCNGSEFNEGTYGDVQWDSTNAWTELTGTGLTNGTGTYTSKVFDTNALSSWIDLSWISTRPTFKGLPNALGTETVYVEGNVDASNNVLLMHLNETSGVIDDASGVTGDGAYSGMLWNQSGKIGSSLGFDGVDDYINLGRDISTVIGGTSSITFWMKTTQAGSDTPWNAPGITGADQTNTGNDVFWGYITAAGNIAIQAGNTAGAQSTTVINDNVWHHVVLTRNATTGVVQVFVDGVLEDTATSETGIKTQYFDGIGRIYDSGGSHGYYQGLLDEVSFWSHVMNPLEVYDQYRRVANRLKFQVRSCDDAVCSGETYIGPDGTASTYFSEESSTVLTLPVSSISGVTDNRYIQYRVNLETDDSTMSPELACARITYLGSPLTTTGDYNAIFHTEEPKANYYIVDSLSATQQMVVISFRDGNDVSDGVTTRVVEEGEMVTLPFVIGMDQFDSYDVTGPLAIGFTGNATDAALPIVYAGKEFVYRVDAGTDVFSFYAPYATANVQIQESNTSGWTTLQTVSVGSNSILTVTQDIINARAFRIVSSEPILGFHQASADNSHIMYPTDLALEQDSGMYELYGVASNNLQLAASTAANVTIYRSNGTNATVTLNASNNFVYTETAGGIQGASYAYHIVSDAPIGATGYNDGDGTEVVAFLSQKEFSQEYVLSNPAQYLSIAAKDPSVTCRVYNASGVEITSGTMDNVPPQTGGTQNEPYPNRIHIGGDDVADGAYFTEGYRMQCSAPVFAYYEHHLSATISDETSWLTWPQVRKGAHVQPIVQDVDIAGEQGFFYPSGFDSATTGNDFEAYAEYTFDTSALMYGEHTYWRDIIWEEIINSRSASGGVTQVSLEAAYADPSPSCDSATYGSYVSPLTTILSATTDTSSPYVTYTTNMKRMILPDAFSDHSCVRVRVYLRTGDQTFAPRLNDLTVGHYIPTLLEDQLDGPTIDVVGATDGDAERYRVIKAITNDPGFNNSNASTTFRAASNTTVFTQADTSFLEIQAQSTNAQFAFPPFPATLPVNAATSSVFDANHDLAVYFTHERTSGGAQTLDYTFNVDVAGTGGAQVSRDFRLNVGGL